MTDRAYLPYLKTLRRIPPEYILDMATREFNMGDGEFCVCGWALREAIGSTLGIDPADVGSFQSWHPLLASEYINAYGGTREEWGDIWYGAEHDFPNVEEAFTRRVMECVT